MNVFLKPVLVTTTLPLTVVTLGLFLLVINVGLIYLAAFFVQGFGVVGFVGPLIFSVVNWILSAGIDAALGDGSGKKKSI